MISLSSQNINLEKTRLLLGFLLFALLFSEGIWARCVMYGQCGGKSNSIFARPLNCPTNRTGLPLSEALPNHRKKFEHICGEYLFFNSTIPDSEEICCDVEQLETLEKDSNLAKTILEACPACLHNFMGLFCRITCSPNQSEFSKVVQTVESPQTNLTIVTELDVQVEPLYGKGIFQSCKEVKFPADNRKVMDLIGGGAINYQEMLTFLGQERTGGSPFQINFPPLQENTTSLNASTLSCNSTIKRCTCVDCEEVCPILPPTPEENPPCLVFCRFGCFNFVLFVLFFLVTLVVLAFAEAMRRNYLLHRDTSLYQPVALTREEAHQLRTNPLRDSIPITHQDRRLLISQMQDGFFQLGYLCASYPFHVIGFSLLLIGIFSLGWLNFTVERRPDKLWVSVESQAAQEKAFFDESFGPFYRTEQFILSSKNKSEPVLSYSTLRLLFEIEKEVMDLKKDGVGLSELCFNPTGNACIIQSVSGMFL